MKVKALYPSILTGNATPILSSLERMGFSIIHRRDNVLDPGDVEYVLENENKQKIDVVHIPGRQEDTYTVRSNVDNFDEALVKYLEEGHSVIKGPVTLPNSKNALIRSPGGLTVLLMQHISKD